MTLRHENPIEEDASTDVHGTPSSHAEAEGVVVRTVEARSLPLIEDRVASLRRRAEKLGVEPLVLVVGARSIRYREVDVLDAHGLPVRNKYREIVTRQVPYEVVEITITGTSPRLPGGWRFVASIDHAGPLNVIRAVPGEKVPPAYRTKPPTCEHCRLARDRRETFVAENDDGKQTQIGRSCLVDFMGHPNAARIADLASSMADLFTDLDDPEAFEGGGGGQRLIHKEEFLAFVVGLVREDGFVSRKTADDRNISSTASQALQRIDPGLGNPYVPPAEEDHAKAKEILAWAEAISGDTENDFLFNVKAVLAKEALSWRDTGIAAASVPAYQRAMGEERDRKHGPARRESEFFGTPGERTRVQVTVEKVVTIDSFEYGPSHIHILRTADGNVAKWKTGTERLEEGKMYDFLCSIDSFEEYRGVKQTILKRCAPYVSPEEKKRLKAHGDLRTELELLVSFDGPDTKASYIEPPPEGEREIPTYAKRRIAGKKLALAGMFEIYPSSYDGWNKTLGRYEPVPVDGLRLSAKGKERALLLALEIVASGGDLHEEPAIGAWDGTSRRPLTESGLIDWHERVVDGRALHPIPKLTDKGEAELRRLRSANEKKPRGKKAP